MKELAINVNINTPLCRFFLAAAPALKKRMNKKHTFLISSVLSARLNARLIFPSMPCAQAFLIAARLLWWRNIKREIAIKSNFFIRAGRSDACALRSSGEDLISLHQRASLDAKNLNFIYTKQNKCVCVGV